jgi:hypothetical protein
MLWLPSSGQPQPAAGPELIRQLRWLSHGARFHLVNRLVTLPVMCDEIQRHFRRLCRLSPIGWRPRDLSAMLALPLYDDNPWVFGSDCSCWAHSRWILASLT